MREKILAILSERACISGEAIGQELGISRSAVWKHIKELRGKGYQIDSSPRLGYRLVKVTDLIVPEEIQRNLSTKFIGRNIIYRKEVSSTQDIASKHAINNAQEGTAIVAESQSAGKARRGRSWVSPSEGGIYVSIILRPDIRPVSAVQIPLVVGVALAKSIQKITSLKPEIKWPNDILINNKKVSGILAEISCEVDRINYILVGIGINVNTRMTELPSDVRVLATSISNECGREISRVELLRHFFTELETVYVNYLINGFSDIRQVWKRLTNTVGSKVKVIDGAQEIRGKALDIDENGFLIILTESGDTIRITGGDVSLRALE